MPTSDELADALTKRLWEADYIETTDGFVSHMLRALARDAAKQALLDAADVTEAAAQGEAYVGGTYMDQAFWLRDRAEQIGKAEV